MKTQLWAPTQIYDSEGLGWVEVFELLTSSAAMLLLLVL